MPIYKFQCKLEAQDEPQAKDKMQHAAVLLRNLSEKELRKLAEIVAENGETLKMAKRFLGL